MRFSSVLFGFIVFFVGCSTKIPTFVELEKQSRIPTSFQNYTQDIKAQESNLLKKETALEQFDLFFGDKVLLELLQIALNRNTNVLIMVSRIEQAKSSAKINGANLYPMVNAGVNTNYTDRLTQLQNLSVRPGTNSISANLSMSWELDLFGKLNALRQSSKKAYEQAQSNLANTQITLMSDVGNVYFALRDNAYNIKLAQNILKNLEEIDSLIHQQYLAGLNDINTYKNAKANLVMQKNMLESLRLTYEQNKNALLVLLDMNSSELDSKVDFLADYTPPSIREFDIYSMPSEVILKRPDVRASILALHAQLYKETNAKLSRLPAISLNGSIGQLLYNNAGVNSFVFQVANSIAAPLLNRTNLEQSYLIAQELSKEAYYTLQHTINTALAEMENALFDRDSKKRQVENLKAVMEVGMQAYKSDKIRLSDGMIDRNEFLNSENSYFSIQSQLYTSRINEAIAMVTLFRAFGGELYAVHFKN